MSQNSKRALLVAAALAIILGITVLLHLPQPAAQDQILGQMEAARAAAQSHNVSGIMRVISADYHGSSAVDSNVDDLHLFLLRTVGHSNEPVQATLSPPIVQVTGNTAQSTTNVTARSTQDNSVVYSGAITLHWKKENGTRWLLVPTKVWRVVSADFPMPSGDAGGSSLF
jgi:ketosteroid isomerase-like protein